MISVDLLRSHLGDLTPDKEILFEAYCTAVERYQEAERKIKDMGVLLRDKNSNKTIENPYLAISRSTLAQISTLAKSLGIDRLYNADPTKKPVEYTEKQRKFAKAYARTGRIEKSAIEAGYSKASASTAGATLLQSTKILSLISQEKTKTEEATRQPSDVIADVRTLTKKALDQGDIKTALACYQLEARYLGMFNDTKSSEIDKVPLPLYEEEPYTVDKPKRIM